MLKGLFWKELLLPLAPERGGGATHHSRVASKAAPFPTFPREAGRCRKNQLAMATLALELTGI